MDIPSLLLMLAIIGLFAWMTLQAFGRKGQAAQRDRRAAENAKKHQLELEGIRFLASSVKSRQLFLFVAAFVFLSVLISFSVLDFSGSAAPLAISTITIAVVVGIVLAVVSSIVADKAETLNRSWISFFWLSLLLSPLITWLVVASMKPSDRNLSTRSIVEPIQQLETLLGKGQITQEEFDKKKSELLDRL